MKSKSGTLTANSIATVTIDVDEARADLELEVLNRDGADEINYTVDGSDPVVGGDDTYVLPAGIGAATLKLSFIDSVTVKLKSAGTPRYTVTVS